MKVNVELALSTREVYQLFERRISGERLFIAAILHKFNSVMNHCKRASPQALPCHHQIERNIRTLSQHFTDEITRVESLLVQRKSFEITKINYVVKYKPMVIVTNPLTMQLIKFIELYDKLVAVLKFLQLAGCFESNKDCLNNIKRYQKIANQMLSSLMFA
jgi:hypothetical protein